jgi:hypothetical protein
MFVLAQTVLQELKHLSNNVFNRVLELIKDTNKSFIFYPNEVSVDTWTVR